MINGNVYISPETQKSKSNIKPQKSSKSIIEKYFETFGDSTGGIIFGGILGIAIILFIFSIGVYFFLILHKFIFPISSILLLVAIFRLKKFGKSFRLRTIFIICELVLFSIVQTKQTHLFMEKFEEFNLTQVDGKSLGTNIKIIYDELWKLTNDQTLPNFLTLIAILITVVGFLLCLYTILMNIIKPHLATEITPLFFIILITLTIIGLTINSENNVFVQLVTLFFDVVHHFFTELIDGFTNS